jgi:hypothetical protein
MKKDASKFKLQLSKQTITQLNAIHMNNVLGGGCTDPLKGLNVTNNCGGVSRDASRCTGGCA